jgi:AcrR family transcriptional regulator
MTGQVLNLQDQKREFTRQRLLEAAEEVFAHKEYHLAKIDDIAAAAGCSRATFYLHFKSKSDLMISLRQRGHEAAIQRYQHLDDMLTSADGLSRADLRLWLGEWQEVWGEWRPSMRNGVGLLHALMLAQVMEPEVGALAQKQSLEFIATLSGFFASLPPGERDAVRARALILEAMSQSVYAMATERILPATDDQYLDYLTDLWADLYIR